MSDQSVYCAAEIGTLSGTTVTLSGSPVAGLLAAMPISGLLTDGQTVTCTVVDASEPSSFAVHSGVPYTAAGTTLDLDAGTLKQGSLSGIGSAINVMVDYPVPLDLIGQTIFAATTKATPVGADSLGLWDSVASALKNLTLTNLVAYLKTYFDGLYPSGSGSSTGTNTGDQDLSGLLSKTLAQGNIFIGDASNEAASTSVVYVDSGGVVRITAPNSASPVLKLYGVLGTPYTQDFLQFYSNVISNTKTFSINMQGGIYTNGGILTRDGGGGSITPLEVRSSASQSADILKIGSSSAIGRFLTIKPSGFSGFGNTNPATQIHNAGAYTQTYMDEPADPSDGDSVFWHSNGTGAGDAGDFMMKTNIGGTVKTITLVDFSAA